MLVAKNTIAVAAKLDGDKEDLEEAVEDVEDAKQDGQDPAAVIFRAWSSQFLQGFCLGIHVILVLFPEWQIKDKGLLGLTKGLMLPEAIQEYEVSVRHINTM